MSINKGAKQFNKSDNPIADKADTQVTSQQEIKLELPDSQQITEQDIIAYLHQHPDFFQGKDDLIELLTLNHPAGQAVSLIERQVNILRNQNTQLNKQLTELFSIAKENDLATQKMHYLILSLLSCNRLHDVFSKLESHLKEEFPVDLISLKLFSPENVVLDSNSTVCIDKKSAQAKALLKLAHKREPVCGFFKDVLTDEQQDIKSMAFMPLFVDKNNCFGSLLLGSEDKHYFKPENGKVFLRNLAEVVSHTLIKYL